MKTKLLFCLCLLLTATTLFGQSDMTVSGIVTEKATGYPAIGVSVLVKGTTKGTVTSVDGEYTLTNVPANSTLVFSYIGMLTQEITVNGRTSINVLLQDDTQNLDEVVVIGYGTSKAKDLTAPIAVIKADEITKHTASSPMSALQGKVPGVQITNSGQPGSGPVVRIRGLGSFDKENGPLYVVDGMFYDNINFLNTADIEDISILKDASAASIYGVRAANGVVLVTTRKGAVNRSATITYDGYVGFQQATNVLKMANSEQYATMIREIGNGNETGLAILDKSAQLFGGTQANPMANTDWYEELLRTALIHNHSIDISGGSEKMAYSLGANYLFQEGIMNVENQYERFNLRAKADYNAFNWLKVGANVVVSNANQIEPSASAWANAFQTPSIIPVMDDRRSAEEAFPVKYASPSQLGMSTYFSNPVANANYYNRKNNSVRVLPTFYAQIDFIPEKLSFKTAYSQDINFVQMREYNQVYKVGGAQEKTVSDLRKDNDWTRNWILDNTLTYRDSFNEHNFTVMAGNSVREENWRNLRGKAPGVPGGEEEYLYLGQGNADGRETGDDGTTYRGVSWFGRIQYDWMGKYILSATMRADGSSKYQQTWGYFPSVGAAWNISEEAFMENQNVFDYLKLRASWGKLGNDKIKASDGFASITQSMKTSGVYGPGILPGYTNLVYFSWLEWEVVNETNVGIDFTTLNNRLRVEADWYYRLTENAVIDAPLPMGAGNLLGNNGEILNTGLEVSLNWSDHIGKDFSYYIGGNMTALKNEVKSLNGLPYIYGGTAEFRTISKVGGELNAYYGHEIAGVYQNQAEINADPIAVANGLVPGDFKYVDQNNDGVINNDDRVELGSYIPNFTYGINLGMNYKNFELSAVMQGVTGNQIVNRKRGDRRWQTDINYDEAQVKNRWTGEGSTNKYPSAAGSIKPWNISKFNDSYVESGAYFRIQNIQAAYTFPKKEIGKVKLPSIRLSLTAERPFTFFKANSFTPELMGTDTNKAMSDPATGTLSDAAIGFDSQVYPLASSYTFGLRIIY